MSSSPELNGENGLAVPNLSASADGVNHQSGNGSYNGVNHPMPKANYDTSGISGRPEPSIDSAKLAYRQDSYRWNRGKYSRNRRFVDIWSFVLQLMVARWKYGKAWTYGGTITPDKQAARRRKLAVWIRETLLDLGPTFIKVGQLFFNPGRYFSYRVC